MSTDSPTKAESSSGPRDQRLAVLDILEGKATEFATASEGHRPTVVSDTCERIFKSVYRRPQAQDVQRVLASWYRRGRPKSPLFGVREREPAVCISKYEALLPLLRALHLCERHTLIRSLKRRLRLDRAQTPVIRGSSISQLHGV